MDIDNILTQHNILYQEYINKQRTKRQLKEQLQQIQESNQVNNQQLINHQSAKTYIEQMIEHLTKNQLDYLENLVNLALQVFKEDDMDINPYEIQFDIQYKRNQNTVLINLKDNINHTLTPIQQNGFGVQSVVGLALNMYYILTYDLYPILFIDEALSAVSTKYMHNLLNLLNIFKQKFNFTFVMIQHDSRLIDMCDIEYQIKGGKVVAKIDNRENKYEKV